MDDMKYFIPKNIGKVRVVMTLGNKYCVWNGKNGKGEFSIPCRTKQQAIDVAKLINSPARPSEIEVMSK